MYSIVSLLCPEVSDYWERIYLAESPWNWCARSVSPNAFELSQCKARVTHAVFRYVIGDCRDRPL